MFVDVIIMPHGDPMLTAFVVFQQAEDILIKITKTLYLIFHYYGVRKEKISMIATIDVRANTWYLHINYDFYS